jgi:hypothetical protein
VIESKKTSELLIKGTGDIESQLHLKHIESDMRLEEMLNLSRKNHEIMTGNSCQNTHAT